MLDSISDVARARPQLRKSARFDLAQWCAWREGYYQGAVAALRAADEAIHRFTTNEQARRVARRKKRTA